MSVRDNKRVLVWVGAGLAGLLPALLLCSCGQKDKPERPDARAYARSLEEPPSVSKGAAEPPRQPAAPVKPDPPRNPPPTPKTVPMITCAMPLLEGVNEDDQQVVELALNDWGTRILVKAKKQICLFDAGNGDLLQTLKRTTPLWGRNPGTEGMYISPEARTVATRTDPPQGVKNPQATIAFYDAETGRATCAANLEHDLEVDEGNVVFAPDGRTLFVCGRLHGKICAQALSARSGASRMLNLPVAGKINCRLEMLTPCPGGSALLGSWGGDRIADKHPSRLSVLNLQGSSERLLQSADIAPFRGLWDRRIAVSPDGRLALIEDMERVGTCREVWTAPLKTKRVVR